ncbi:MAG: glycosyltransferase family 4 protein, partial [Ferruginibacter sp.]
IAFFNRYLCRFVNLTCVTVKANNPTLAEPYPIKKILSDRAARYINPLYFFKLKRIIKEQQVTHLIIEHPYYGWLGILLKWFCKVKLVVHSHNIESLRFKSTGKWWWGILWHYEKQVHGMADMNFFIHDDDRDFAIKNFKLDPEKCITITYGFELTEAPAASDKGASKERICVIHGIDKNDRILLFNGTLSYKPNLDALDTILNSINPLLLADSNFAYKIIICGSKLPAVYNGLINYKESNIIYAGFVDDINLYFKGCDIFINPVIEGGGIKTKVVEALGYGMPVISTSSGATGIPADITGGKLQVLPDNNWSEFTRAIVACNTGKKIPSSYFDHFYWGNIAQKAAHALHS